MRKVLFVFIQSSNKANGGVNSLCNILTNLKQVKPIVYTNTASSFTELLQNKGIEVIINKRSATTKAFWQTNLKLYRIIKKKKIDSVHCNDIIALRAGALAAKLAGKRLVFNIRGVKEKGEKYDWKWYIVNFCDEIIFLSKEMKKALLLRWPGKKKFKSSVSYSIVEVINRQEKLNLPVPYNFLVPAVIRPLKNQLSFLEFLREKKHLIPEDWHFHFVGDVDQNDEYCKKCLILAEKLKKIVTFYGYQNNMSSWYKASFVTLIPFQSEGLSRGMIESISYGIPVISFDVCSAKEILEGESPCGRVVPQDNYEKMISIIQELVQNKEQYKRYSRNGTFLSHNLFEKGKVVKVYEDAYLS